MPPVLSLGEVPRGCLQALSRAPLGYQGWCAHTSPHASCCLPGAPAAAQLPGGKLIDGPGACKGPLKLHDLDMCTTGHLPAYRCSPLATISLRTQCPPAELSPSCWPRLHPLHLKPSPVGGEAKCFACWHARLPNAASRWAVRTLLTLKAGPLPDYAFRAYLRLGNAAAFLAAFSVFLFNYSNSGIRNQSVQQQACHQVNDPSSGTVVVLILRYMAPCSPSASKQTWNDFQQNSTASRQPEHAPPEPPIRPSLVSRATPWLHLPQSYLSLGEAPADGTRLLCPHVQRQVDL
eukprot:362504-Chlamydomonas_euryale.AAC.17